MQLGRGDTDNVQDRDPLRVSASCRKVSCQLFHGVEERLRSSDLRTDSVDSRQLADSERGEQSTESAYASLRLVGSLSIFGVTGLRVGLLALVEGVHLRLLDAGIAVCGIRGVELVAVADPLDALVLLDEIEESQVELSWRVHGRCREG